MSMKVYLAAPYAMKDTIKQRAMDLEANGITCTSSWVNEPHKPTTQMSELAPAVHEAYAIQDVVDVRAADIFVFHTDPTMTIVRGGRHVEFGIAVGIGITRLMPIFVVGLEEENIFHHLPSVRHFATWEETLDELKLWARDYNQQ